MNNKKTLCFLSQGSMIAQNTIKLIDSLLFNAKWVIFHLYHGEEEATFNEMLIICIIPPCSTVYSVSTLKQQSTGNYVAPLGHIISIPSQPVFAPTPYCCVLRGEATNTSFIVLKHSPIWSYDNVCSDHCISDLNQVSFQTVLWYQIRKLFQHYTNYGLMLNMS